MRLLLYARAVFIILSLIPLTIVLATILMVGAVFTASTWFGDLIVRDIWCRWVVWSSGLDIHVEGSENVPLEGGCLFLFSHSSHLDIPVLAVSSPKSLRFGAKKELFSIPFFGQGMRAVGTLPITREDREKVIEVYRQAEKKAAQGQAFALAPEGGRRRTKEIKSFKTGPFIFAINAGLPIVPVVICGLDEALPPGSALINTRAWKKRAVVRFLPKVDVSGYTKETAKKLRDRVREHMIAAHNDLRHTTCL